MSQITDKLLSVLTPTGAWLAKWLWSLTSNRVDQEAYLDNMKSNNMSYVSPFPAKVNKHFSSTLER
jgi:hypothetical protein